MAQSPSAKLLSTSEFPQETIYCIWYASRAQGACPTPKEVHDTIAAGDVELQQLVEQTFAEVIMSEIPVAENLDFIFLIEGMPISLREQIVRHRIGHRFGENFAVDIIPGDVQDSWWSQSMRVLDMGNFAVHGEYFVPDTIDDREVENGMAHPVGRAREIYEHFMLQSAEVYRDLVRAGVPPEDARQVIPLAATSRMTWKMNFQSLRHILSRRGCWIAQLGMWRPLVEDIVRELGSKIHPIFHNLVNPPCLRGNAFVGCPFIPDNLKRLTGQDPEPPCPMFLTYHRDASDTVKKDWQFMPPRAGLVQWDAKTGEMRAKFDRLQKAYGRLWNRNVWTGATLGQ